MISERIKKASSFIEKDDVVVDVGCDHGYLGLLADKIPAKKIYFIDNKEEPLKKSYDTANNLIKNAEAIFLLSDGLTKIVNYAEINKIFILGMGGENIIHILKSSLDKIDPKTLIILDAHTKIKELREFIFNNYFRFISEIIIKENNHFYELIAVKKTDKLVDYNELDLLFGPILRKEKDPLFIEKWSKKLKKDEEILKNKPNIQEIIDERDLIKKVL